MPAAKPKTAAPNALRFLATPITATALLLVTLALALLPLIFSTGWYRYNCDYHDRCNNLGTQGVEQRASNMGKYFLHLEPLATSWDARGRAHLQEVREIYKVLAVVALAAAAILFFMLWQDPTRLGSAGRTALVMILATTIIIPLFGPFWEKVFHPLLFNNDLWRTRPGEVLWNLTPRVFFRNSAVVLISASALLNLIAWQIGGRLWPLQKH